MRNFVRRPQQDLAREVNTQLADMYEPYIESPQTSETSQEKALLDAYEASFSSSLVAFSDYEDEFNRDYYDVDAFDDSDSGSYVCNCPDCRMQDWD